MLDFFRGTLPAGRVLRLIENLPPTSRTVAVFASKAPDRQEETLDPSEQWRRWWGWDTDRNLRHSAVSVQLDEEGRTKWERTRPGSGLRAGSANTGSLSDLAAAFEAQARAAAQAARAQASGARS